MAPVVHLPAIGEAQQVAALAGVPALNHAGNYASVQAGLDGDGSVGADDAGHFGSGPGGWLSPALVNLFYSYRIRTARAHGKYF